MSRVFKQYEMSWPSRSPRPPRGTLGAASYQPVFLDVNGNPVTEVVCGDAYTFDVPGWTGGQIHLTMTKNGQPAFDDLFTVPMPSYTSTCANDVGTYQVMAYDPLTGILLGQTTFQVAPAGTVIPKSTTSTGILAWLENLTTVEKVALAAGAFLLLN